MQSYADFLRARGFQEPTLGDMLGAVLARTSQGKAIKVYTYDEALKKEIGLANTRIELQRP